MEFGNVNRQEQRQTQQLAARQLQGLELLNLPALALEEKLNGFLNVNPLLESDGTEFQEEFPPAAPAPEREESAGDDEADWENAAIASEEWREELPVPADGENPLESEERRNYLLNSLTAAPDWRSALEEELRLFPLPQKKRKLTELVVAALDERGYLRSTAADLAMQANATLEETAEAIRFVQTLDPPGIGARDLAECLKLQLIRKNEWNPLREELLSHLDDVEFNRLPQLAAKLHISLEELQQELDRLKSLNPYPGSALSEDTAAVIRPEAAIEKDETGAWRVRPLRGGAPKLFLSERYLKMLEDPALPADARTYLRGKLHDAKEILQALEQRESTILRLAGVIAETQQEFLEKGIDFLRPLTQKEAADRLGVHEATVSRAAADKYVETPRGVLPFKFFFSSGFTDDAGSGVSSRAVQEKLKKLIEEEDPFHPLSDDRLAALLAESEGVQIARRTVAKYREALRIPSSTLRKRHR